MVIGYQISVEDRLAVIDGQTTKFREHLIQTPGAVLPAVLRLAVVHYARDATSCTECADKLPQGACLRPGTDVYSVIEKIEHSAPGKDVPESLAQEVQTVLKTIVYSIVNHQGRLDQKWHVSVLRKLLETPGILPSDAIKEEKQRQCLAPAAFSEIVVLTVTAHAMNVAHTVLGRPLPPLPSLKDMKKQEPMLLDWSSLLKRAPRQDTKVCFAHCSYPGDYNQKHPDFQRISKEVWTAMSSVMGRMEPCLPVAYATEDTVFFKELSEVYYVPERNFMDLHNTELDPRVRCADAFTRHDTEFVVTAIAEAHNCGF